MRKKTIDNYGAVKLKFIKYLEEKKMRRTQERFEILKCVCSMSKHFDIDTIFMKMKNNKFRVSRATLYKTMDLLLDCGIVTKYQFTSEAAEYEFVNPSENTHYHIVLSDSGEIIEFEDERIDKVVKELELRHNICINKCQFVMYANNKKDKYGK